MRRGQSWSVDLVVAVVIFGFIAIVITSFVLLDKPDIETLQVDAQRVSGAIDGAVLLLDDGTDCGVLLDGERINDASIDCLYGAPPDNYAPLRQSLGVEGDFCIFLEDENGQVIAVANRNGWGSGDLTIADEACGTDIVT